MAHKPAYAVGLDVGSERTRCVIGVLEYSALRLIGFGESESTGIVARSSSATCITSGITAAGGAVTSATAPTQRLHSLGVSAASSERTKICKEIEMIAVFFIMDAPCSTPRAELKIADKARRAVPQSGFRRKAARHRSVIAGGGRTRGRAGRLSGGSGCIWITSGFTLQLIVALMTLRTWQP